MLLGACFFVNLVLIICLGKEFFEKGYTQFFVKVLIFSPFFLWMIAMSVYCTVLVVSKHLNVYWGVISLINSNLCINDIEALEPLFIGLLTG